MGIGAITLALLSGLTKQVIDENYKKNLKTKIYETIPDVDYCDNTGQILSREKILDKLKTYRINIDITKDKESIDFMEKMVTIFQQKKFNFYEDWVIAIAKQQEKKNKLKKYQNDWKILEREQYSFGDKEYLCVVFNIFNNTLQSVRKTLYQIKESFWLVKQFNENKILWDLVESYK